MKHSEFRNWVHNLWIENCEERQQYHDEPRLSSQEYFHRFRWWLRREWQHQRRRQQEMELRQKALTRSLRH